MKNNEDTTQPTQKDTPAPPDEGVVYSKTITIRPPANFVPAMELIISQRVNEKKEYLLPLLVYKGKYPNAIESWRFCRDYGLAWIQASFIMLERTMLVKGRK